MLFKAFPVCYFESLFCQLANILKVFAGHHFRVFYLLSVICPKQLDMLAG